MKSKVGYTISELENLVEGKNLKNILNYIVYRKKNIVVRWNEENGEKYFMKV